MVRRAIPIGRRISERRRELGLSQKEVAALAGMSVAYLSLIEHDKRTIGGLRLQRLAAALRVEFDNLSGSSEMRVAQDLEGIFSDSLFDRDDVGEDAAARLVGLDPALARAFRALYRAYVEARDQTVALSNRLGQDPALLELSHQILNRITAMRSVSEILAGVDDIPPEREAQFHNVLAQESGGLVEVVGGLLQILNSGNPAERAGSPADEVDDFIIDHRYYFPTLEAAAVRMRQLAAREGRRFEQALADTLARRHGVDVVFESRTPDGAADADFDFEAGRLVLFEGIPDASVRFHLARLIARLECQTELSDLVADERLTSPAAEDRAKGALERYLAAAILFPYDTFLASAIELRYDVERLARRFGGSFEQIAHRLVSLKCPGAEGVPFAFMRVDAAGNISKRFSLPNLRLPRYRESCAYWAAFEAFATPGRVVTQRSAMPTGAEFLMIARKVTRPEAGFGIPPARFAVMIACDFIYRDRLVYGDGLGGTSDSLRTPVGVTCRLCPRTECRQRAHPPVVPPQAALST
jgi:hypothetical protein